MLSDVFTPFVQASPLAVMMRGLVERLLNPEQMNQGFEHLAQEQYTRELLFSTVVGLMLDVVCGTRKSVNTAYPAMQEAIPVRLQAVYAKRRGVEPGVTAELVRYAARSGQAVITTLAGTSPALLPGYPVRSLDGNPLAATEHRLKELRTYAGGALPGLARVVYDPAHDLVVDVVPGERAGWKAPGRRRDRRGWWKRQPRHTGRSNAAGGWQTMKLCICCQMPELPSRGQRIGHCPRASTGDRQAATSRNRQRSRASW